MKKMMVRILIAVFFVIAGVKAEENRWVWGGKDHRSERAYSNDEVPNKYDNLYAREKDREPTTRKPPPGQTSQEDYLNPDDLRNYNGPPNFGNPIYGQGGGSANNFPPGYGQQPGVNIPQNNPNSGFPYPGIQPGFPGFGGGFPGGYPQMSNNGFPNQQGYPNQGSVQGYPQTGPPYPGAHGGKFPGGFQGQGGGFPYPQQAGTGYPGQGGFPSQQSGYPNQFPGGIGYPLAGGGQHQIGQYAGCVHFGNCGQLSQHPSPYPGQYPYPYPGLGRYPEPFAHPHHAGNPYGVTPYNSNSEGPASSVSDDYEDLSKNGTDNSNSALKVEGKTGNARNSQQKLPDTKLDKHKKTYE